jgi:hypothetical protein
MMVPSPKNARLQAVIKLFFLRKCDHKMLIVGIKLTDIVEIGIISPNRVRVIMVKVICKKN